MSGKSWQDLENRIIRGKAARSPFYSCNRLPAFAGKRDKDRTFCPLSTEGRTNLGKCRPIVWVEGPRVVHDTDDLRRTSLGRLHSVASFNVTDDVLDGLEWKRLMRTRKGRGEDRAEEKDEQVPGGTDRGRSDENMHSSRYETNGQMRRDTYRATVHSLNRFTYKT